MRWGTVSPSHPAQKRDLPTVGRLPFPLEYQIQPPPHQIWYSSNWNRVRSTSLIAVLYFSGLWNIDDQHRNTNMNDKDHLVRQLSRGWGESTPFHTSFGGVFPPLKGYFKCDWSFVKATNLTSSAWDLTCLCLRLYVWGEGGMESVHTFVTFSSGLLRGLPPKQIKNFQIGNWGIGGISPWQRGSQIYPQRSDLFQRK